ncbi:hypothetical protein MTP99_003761 [Tenebrio molitor]|nr:hypothetical protein MTP99_003761 [Tenebrio molitor]
MDQKSAAVIYRMFYSILHLVFTIYESVESMYRSLKIKLLELRHEFKINKTEKLVKIEKIPRHLTVLLGTEEPSPKDLANLILWCLAARITFVSFYDHKGELKKKEEKLRLLVEGMKIASDHVIWHSDPDSAPKNGYTGRKIHVKVLSRDDGRGGVVNIVLIRDSKNNSNFPTQTWGCVVERLSVCWDTHPGRSE